MRVSRLKIKSGSSSRTGGTVQGRAILRILILWYERPGAEYGTLGTKRFVLKKQSGLVGSGVEPGGADAPLGRALGLRGPHRTHRLPLQVWNIHWDKLRLTSIEQILWIWWVLVTWFGSATLHCTSWIQNNWKPFNNQCQNYLWSVWFLEERKQSFFMDFFSPMVTKT